MEPNEKKSGYSPSELHLARLIYRALRRQTQNGVVSGAPSEGETTLIDGQFDLRRVARKILMTTQEDASPAKMDRDVQMPSKDDL